MSAPRNVQAADLPPLEVVELVDPKQMVEVYFAKEPIMIRVAECESSLRHYDKNGNVLRGHVDKADSGIFQINTRYHLKDSKELGLDIFTPMGNIQYADYLYRTQGLQPWIASKPCWSAE